MSRHYCLKTIALTVAFGLPTCLTVLTLVKNLGLLSIDMLVLELIACILIIGIFQVGIALAAKATSWRTSLKLVVAALMAPSMLALPYLAYGHIVMLQHSGWFQPIYVTQLISFLLSWIGYIVVFALLFWIPSRGLNEISSQAITIASS